MVCTLGRNGGGVFPAGCVGRHWDLDQSNEDPYCGSAGRWPAHRVRDRADSGQRHHAYLYSPMHAGTRWGRCVSASGCVGRAARGVRPTAGATNFYGAIGIGINRPLASDGVHAGTRWGAVCFRLWMRGPRCARCPANGRGYEFLPGHWDGDQPTVGFGCCARGDAMGAVYFRLDAWAAIGIWINRTKTRTAVAPAVGRPTGCGIGPTAANDTMHICIHRCSRSSLRELDCRRCSVRGATTRRPRAVHGRNIRVATPFPDCD